MLGDYCKYSLKLGDNNELMGCTTTFLEHHVTPEYLTRHEKKRKNISNDKVCKKFFNDVGKAYGKETQCVLEKQHDTNLNGFFLNELGACLVLFEMGFCAKRIRMTMRYHHNNTVLSSFGLASQWEEFDRYKTLNEFVLSFRGNCGRLKQVLRKCVMSDAESFFFVESRPYVFRHLGDVDHDMYKHFSGYECNTHEEVSETFEYGNKNFFNVEKLAPFIRSKIITTEIQRHVTSMTLLTCVGTVKNMKNKKRLKISYSEDVVKLRKDMRKMHISFSDRKKITALHILASGECFFQINGESQRTYDQQKRLLKHQKCDLFLHNVNCVSSKVFAFMIHFAKKTINVQNLQLVLSNDEKTNSSMAWNIIREVIELDLKQSQEHDPVVAAQEIFELESITTSKENHICLVDAPIKERAQKRRINVGDVAYSTANAVFGRVKKIANGVVELVDNDVKFFIADFVAAEKIEGLAIVPAACESATKVSETVCAVASTKDVAARMSRKLSHMTSEPVSMFIHKQTTTPTIKISQDFVRLLK